MLHLATHGRRVAEKISSSASEAVFNASDDLVCEQRPGLVVTPLTCHMHVPPPEAFPNESKFFHYSARIPIDWQQSDLDAVEMRSIRCTECPVRKNRNRQRNEPSTCVALINPIPNHARPEGPVRQSPKGNLSNNLPSQGHCQREGRARPGVIVESGDPLREGHGRGIDGVTRRPLRKPVTVPGLELVPPGFVLDSEGSQRNVRVDDARPNVDRRVEAGGRRLEKLTKSKHAPHYSLTLVELEA